MSRKTTPVSTNHSGIEEHGNASNGHIAIALFQQANQDVRAAGGGPRRQTPSPSPSAAEHAAVKGADQRLREPAMGIMANSIDQHRAEHHAHQRPPRKTVLPILAPPSMKQRDVDQHGQHAHAAKAQQLPQRPCARPETPPGLISLGCPGTGQKPSAKGRAAHGPSPANPVDNLPRACS